MCLDVLVRCVLRAIIEWFNGGPVGIETIASAIGEARVTLEDVTAPNLLPSELMYRTQKGRMASRKAYEHLGLMALYSEK